MKLRVHKIPLVQNSPLNFEATGELILQGSNLPYNFGSRIFINGQSKRETLYMRNIQLLAHLESIPQQACLAHGVGNARRTPLFPCM